VVEVHAGTEAGAGGKGDLTFLLLTGLTWERLAADYNVLEGGLMPLGLLVLLLSPLIAGKVRNWCNAQDKPGGR